VGTPEAEALKAVLVRNNWWAEVCTICVFAGLIIEYTILLWLKRKSFSRLELTLTILAGIAVAGGVFGEYHFGKTASNAAIQLGDISEKQTAAAQLEASAAILKAAELESQIADRHVTLEQRKKMLEILASGRGTPIAIGYLTESGADAPEYSLELAEVFCEAKWVVSRPIELISSEPLHGFLLDVETQSSSKPGSHSTSRTPAPTPPSKRLVGSVKEALNVTGYETFVQSPSPGFQLGGNVPSCKTLPASAGNPAWYPTALELLVGNK